MDWDQSFQQAVDEIAAWLPNLIGALVILLVGYLVARVVSRIVRRALSAAGADRVIANGTAGAYAERLAPGVKPSSVLATSRSGSSSARRSCWPSAPSGSTR